MAKRNLKEARRKAAAPAPAPKRIRCTFTLPAELVARVQRHLADLKATDRAAGRNLTTGGDVIEAALEAHLPAES